MCMELIDSDVIFHLVALIWLKETEDVGEDMDEMRREAETQRRMPEVIEHANHKLYCWMQKSFLYHVKTRFGWLLWNT